MKKIIFTLFFAITSMLQAQKISTIDMDKCFLKYYKTIDAEKRLKEQVSIMEDQAVTMEKQRKLAISEYKNLMQESTSVLNNEETRKKYSAEAKVKGDDIRRMEQNMKSFNTDARDRLAKQHNESRTKILKEIKKVIVLVAKGKNTDLVLDSSGKTSNLISGVVYAKESMDITQSVIDILNKGHEKEVEEWEKSKKASQPAVPAAPVNGN